MCIARYSLFIVQNIIICVIKNICFNKWSSLLDDCYPFVCYAKIPFRVSLTLVCLTLVFFRSLKIMFFFVWFIALRGDERNTCRASENFISLFASRFTQHRLADFVWTLHKCWCGKCIVLIRKRSWIRLFETSFSSDSYGRCWVTLLNIYNVHANITNCHNFHDVVAQSQVDCRFDLPV